MPTFNIPVLDIDVDIYPMNQGDFSAADFDSGDFETGQPGTVVFDVPVLELIATINSVLSFPYSIVGGEVPYVPLTHMQEANKLEADGVVELFQIVLVDNETTLYLKNNNDAVWQGNTYEGTAIGLDGVARSANDERSRPSLKIVNPQGIYSKLIDEGLMDGATVSRIRVLKTHLDDDIGIYTRQSWRVHRTVSMTNEYAIFELRDRLDGQFFQIPGRMFLPPEFGQVSLG